MRVKISNYEKKYISIHYLLLLIVVTGIPVNNTLLNNFLSNFDIVLVNIIIYIIKKYHLVFVKIIFCVSLEKRKNLIKKINKKDKKFVKN